MSRRSAPRRSVLEVWRTGEYATTQWHHRLSCGHIEARKRRAPAAEIGCLRCEAADEVADRSAPDAAPLFGVDDGSDMIALRVRLAAAMSVPVEAVTLQYAMGRVAGALILLDAMQVSDKIAN